MNAFRPFGGRIATRLNAVCRDGFRQSVRVALDQAALSGLRSIFGFHPWHAQSPTSARPYRQGVADLVNNVAPQVVVEVGCGLGAILARVNAAHRFGYDVDPGVIRAARLIRSRSIIFAEGGFDQVSQPHIDVLIAVNWPHDFPANQMQRWLEPLFSRIDYLLVDIIDPGSQSAYSHYHDYAFLGGHAEPVATSDCGEKLRRFVLFKVVR